MGRLLAALRAEREPAATPATLATIPAPTGQESQSRKSRNGCEQENATVQTPMVAESQESQTVPPDTVAARARLLACCDTEGTDPALIRALSEVELAAYADVPAHLLPGYLSTIADTADRQAGRVPAGHTAPMHCARCGLVWAHPGMAAALPVVGGWPRALGCPWCFVRRAGGYIPRPRVTCDGCRYFAPGTINPTAGIATCGAGKGLHYPMARHTCTDYSPERCA